MRMLAICGLACALGGCLGFNKDKDAKVPGDKLGTFHAVGKLEADHCNAPLLGAVDPWEFDLQLSRQGDGLYWLNGQEAIPGSIAADGVSFSFDSGIEVTLEAPRGALPGCVIDRSDTASGELSGASTDVASFKADMAFGYAAKTGTDCSAWIGVDGGFANLPCSLSYAVTGSRTALPK